LSSPTQRTLALLRDEGYLADVVEKWIPGANVRKDLWGWCDIVAIRDNTTYAIQCTSDSNVAARVEKIEDSDTIAVVRRAGWKVEVWGWKKVKNRWRVRKVDVS